MPPREGPGTDPNPSEIRMRTVSRRTPLLALALAGAAVGTAVAASLSTGPSSSQSPYLVPSTLGVEITSILTVGDSVNLKPNGTPYRMVGIPDGLGAFEDGDDDCGRDTFTLLMNHELTSSVGAVRAHGAKGAFVSKWTIDKRTLKVVRGEDLIQRIWRRTSTGWDASTPYAITRLCSADLPERSAFYDRKSKKGYEGRLFMNGEESGVEGSAFAHAMTGDSYQLPSLGKFAWENCVANPDAGVKTVVVGTDDGTGGQVYVYVGTKQKTGNPVEKAGLTNGELFGIQVPGYASENALTGIPDGTPFTAHAFGDVTPWTGATLEAQSQANLVTSFQRPEDGAWDPENPSDFYFVTTASFTGASRLWRLRFVDPANPVAGGRIDLLLDGTEGPKMMDNLCVSRDGQILIQEDPGNQPTYLAKVWRYDLATGVLVEVAAHDPARFSPSSSGYLTGDEESSGIIDVSDILGDGRFLCVSQAHSANADAELVEGGQLMLLGTPVARGCHGGGHGRGYGDPRHDAGGVAPGWPRDRR